MKRLRRGGLMRVDELLDERVELKRFDWLLRLDMSVSVFLLFLRNFPNLKGFFYEIMRLS